MVRRRAGLEQLLQQRRPIAAGQVPAGDGRFSNIHISGTVTTDELRKVEKDWALSYWTTVVMTMDDTAVSVSGKG